MAAIEYRPADPSDVPAMARIRAAEWETEEYWRARIARYMDCELQPQQALLPRALYVALEGEGGAVVGLIAGHLTRRYQCDGELEWINVAPQYRGSEVAPALLRLLAAWFAGQKARRICVDVDPSNEAARRFYTRHGAGPLNPHWLVWHDINVVLNGQSPKA
jgi:ribosomal protein S18 acetylase RimI-like enzyme